MTYQVAIIAFVVSFLGSVPPGTINITSMQLAIKDQRRAALFFALAASLTEFIYAGLTVRFHIFLSSRAGFTDYLQIITAGAMIIIGILNLRSKTKTTELIAKTDRMKGRSGFKRGVLLGIFNPLTIPFWLAVTAYLQSHNWISLENACFWSYLAGISLGTFSLLLLVNHLGNRFTSIADNQFLVHRLPGFLFIGLGVYNLILWFF